MHVKLFPGVHTPGPGDELRLPVTPGPGYNRDASLENIRENYEFLPELLNQTLPRALSDPGTAAGLQQLREDGWRYWHILIAILNAALNIRAAAAGLLDHPLDTQQEQQALARTPETADSAPIPLAALTPQSLTYTMQIAMLAIARRRLRLLSATQTPNLTAFRALLATRYGWNDDVPHRDLLADAENGNPPITDQRLTRSALGAPTEVLAGHLARQRRIEPATAATPGADGGLGCCALPSSRAGGSLTPMVEWLLPAGRIRAREW